MKQSLFGANFREMGSNGRECFFFLLLAIAFNTVDAQNNYAEAIQRGDAAFNNGQFKVAINRYFAAEAYDPSKKEIVKEKVNVVFEKIETLRKKAEDSEREANKAKKETELALSKANKLINAFYFYKDRFALATGGTPSYRLFRFIDRNGDYVEKLGEWENATQFEEATGFAKIEERRNYGTLTYLLDTSGSQYEVVYDSKSIGNETRALDMSGIHLDTFPAETLEAKELQVLILNGEVSNPNNFQVLPSGIGSLKHLQYFHVAQARITSLPPEIGALENLKSLNVSGNLLKNLPPEIGSLKNLTYLGLKENEIQRLPPQIGELKNLKSLDLTFNFDLSGELFKSLLSVADRLTNLSELYLRGNVLDSLPAEISRFKSLTKLNLRETGLKDLSDQIGELKSLMTLEIGGNVLKSLPDGITDLENLTYLDLQENQLTSLPGGIERMRSLQFLNLNDNQLTDLPNQIGKLKNLQELHLGKNHLKRFPETIGSMIHLTALDLGDNELTTLPNQIAQLKNLTKLGLYGNPISKSELEKIKKLLPGCKIVF